MKSHPTERKAIPEGPYDLAIVGGGINGAAIARDAARRGKTVVLFEKGDFGAGTSGRTSKMVHGGIRYLEQLRFGLVHESLRERAWILRLAPHLVRPQRFLLPTYEGASRGPRRIRAGLLLYDALAAGRRLGASSFLDRTRALEALPGLQGDGLLGAGAYFDAVMDDARLVLLNLMAALEEQGQGSAVVIRNHAEVTEVRSGSPCRVAFTDRIAHTASSVLAHSVVKALGPWTEPEFLVPSRGIHVVLPALPFRDGLLLTHSKDRRVFFMVPWLGRTIVGTTETPWTGSPDDLRVEPSEVSYLLEEVQRLFPQLQLGAREMLGTFAGIRPLARSWSLFPGGPGSVSRRHRIRDEGNGVWSVFGGKYTTYRRVAKQVVDRLFPGSSCTTHRAPLPGGEAGNWQAASPSFSAEEKRCGREEIQRLFQRYGTRLREILRLIDEDRSLGERLIASHPEVRAEVVHAVRREMAAYPADFLARRTTMRWTQDKGRSAYDEVESLIRKHAACLPPDLDRARESYFAECAWEDGLREACDPDRPRTPSPRAGGSAPAAARTKEDSAGGGLSALN